VGALPTTLRIALAALAWLVAGPAPLLQAQGSMQELVSDRIPPRLFGYGAGTDASAGLSRYRSPYAWPWSREPGAGADWFAAEPASSYRTLCVRLCDGYYFPVSAAAPSSSLARDADKCSASCGADARLFYHASVGGSVETMIDLTGMAYSSLPNAFRYRKTLVEGCSCRPQPWSEAELQRHRGYAQDRPIAATTAIDVLAPARAGGDPTHGALSGDAGREPLAAVRPEPVDRSELEQGAFTAQPLFDPRMQWPAARDTWGPEPPLPYRRAGSQGGARSYYVWPSGRQPAR
jgi:hypothetical protein